MELRAHCSFMCLCGESGGKSPTSLAFPVWRHIYSWRWATHIILNREIRARKHAGVPPAHRGWHKLCVQWNTPCGKSFKVLNTILWEFGCFLFSICISIYWWSSIYVFFLSIITLKPDFDHVHIRCDKSLGDFCTVAKMAAKWPEDFVATHTSSLGVCVHVCSPPVLIF